MSISEPGRAAQLLVIAGEASGDAHAARVVQRLKELVPQLTCFGLGGEQLAAQGLQIIGDPSQLNVVGLSEVVSALPRIRRLRDTLLGEVAQRSPRAALLVDLPGFNLHLAARLKRMNIPVIYYIAPQAWAWRKGRVKKIRKRVDRLCVIFPFEQQFFSEQGIRTDFVGHPLLEDVAEPQAHSLSAGAGPRVAIVPGSRPREIERLLPALAGAARLLKDRSPDLQFALPLAPGVERGRVETILKEAGIQATLVEGGARAALNGARLGLVTSGTATLEGALAGVPMVVVYRVSRTSYALVRPIFQLKHICIVNILAGQGLVPELLQGRVRPDIIAQAGAPFLDDGPQRQAVVDGLERVAASLAGPVASSSVAAIVAQELAREAA